MTIAETSLRPSADREGHLRTDDLMADLGRRTARGGVVTITSQGLKFVLSMIATIVLARLLTPQDYGLIGMVGVITGFISIFKDLGLASATIQKSDLSQAQISTLFWINVFFSICTLMLTAAIAPFVARFYSEPRLLGITVAYSVGFLFSGLTVQHEALLKRRMRFLAVAIVEMLSLVTGIAIAIFFAWRGFNYWALIISQLTQGLVYAIGVWIACRWIPSWPSRHSGVGSMLAFGRNLTGFSIVNYFARNLDNLLIGRFWGSQQLGLYARAYQLLMLPLEQINAPIASVAMPALSRLADTPERYRAAYLRLLEKIELLTMPLMAFMIASSDWLVLLLLGPKWAGVSPIFAFLGIAGLFQPILSTAGIIYLTQGRSHHMFQWGLIGSSIIIASFFIGLPWGALGVAIAYSSIFPFIITPLVFWFVGREGPVRSKDLYKTSAPFFTAAVTSLLAALVFRRWFAITTPIVGIVSSAAVVSITAFIVLLLTSRGRAALRDAFTLAMMIMRRASSAEVPMTS
jgi:O-antigen/teichoic acid export membrane protein